MTPLRDIVGAARARRAFTGSEQYWEHRYKTGGSSGPGSYGAVADYKAHFMNTLVGSKEIKSTIEFGCGDGNQLALTSYPRYVGLDVSPTAISTCMGRFADDRTKSFFLYSPDHFLDRQGLYCADLAVSLDVIIHLVEDTVFETYMRHLFGAGRRYVVIYSSNDRLRDPAPHVRHRNFSQWVDTYQPEWVLAGTERSPYRSVALADFYLYENTSSTADLGPGHE